MLFRVCCRPSPINSASNMNMDQERHQEFERLLAMKIPIFKYYRACEPFLNYVSNDAINLPPLHKHSKDFVSATMRLREKNFEVDGQSYKGKSYAQLIQYRFGMDIALRIDRYLQRSEYNESQEWGEWKNSLRLMDRQLTEALDAWIDNDNEH
eukprot:1292038-Rhodomonas_salina.1